MADFEGTRRLLDRALQRRGDESIDLGGMKVERGFTGEVQIIDSEKAYSMDRVPVEVFEKLTQAMKTYSELSCICDDF